MLAVIRLRLNTESPVSLLTSATSSRSLGENPDAARGHVAYAAMPAPITTAVVASAIRCDHRLGAGRAATRYRAASTHSRTSGEPASLNPSRNAANDSTDGCERTLTSSPMTPRASAYPPLAGTIADSAPRRRRATAI